MTNFLLKTWTQRAIAFNTRAIRRGRRTGRKRMHTFMKPLSIILDRKARPSVCLISSVHPSKGRTPPLRPTLFLHTGCLEATHRVLILNLLMFLYRMQCPLSSFSREVNVHLAHMTLQGGDLLIFCGAHRGMDAGACVTACAARVNAVLMHVGAFLQMRFRSCNK